MVITERLIDLSGEFRVLTVVVRILFAAALGGLIGSERGRHGRAAGLRTHILVCVGAAMTSLTSIYLAEALGSTGDVTRLSAQVISGIGFLGAGIIMIRNGSVITGLTTAAGMWVTAVIGIAAGYGFYSGALIAALLCVFSVTVLSMLERDKKNIINAYIELSDITLTNEVVGILNEHQKAKVSYDIMPAKSGKEGNVGILCSVSNVKYYNIIKERINTIEQVVIMVSDINA